MNTSVLKKVEDLAGGRLTLGKAIWSLRMCEEISQEAYARQLGVSRQYLCDLEHDRKEVSPRKAALFARALEQSEKQFVRLALRDMLERQGMHYEIELREAA